MKTLLILSLILSATLLIRAAVVPPTVANLQQVKLAAAPEAGNSANKAVAQARFSFCPDGWFSFRGNCYFLVNHAETWANAERFCASFEANLASVHSIFEYIFLQRLLRAGGHSFGWIGGYYFEGAWRWEDGSELDYQNLGTVDNPDIFQCLQMDSQGNQGWNSNDCSTPFPFLCQVNPSC